MPLPPRPPSLLSAPAAASRLSAAPTPRRPPQAEAERRKRATVLASEGDKQAEINRAEGQKQRVILESEAAMLDSANRAKGEAEAIVARARATAESVAALAEAIGKDGGAEAVRMRVAEQYVDAFGKIAKEGTTVLLPSGAADPASMVAQALAIYKARNAALWGLWGLWVGDESGVVGWGLTARHPRLSVLPQASGEGGARGAASAVRAPPPKGACKVSPDPSTCLETLTRALCVCSQHAASIPPAGELGIGCPALRIRGGGRPAAAAGSRVRGFRGDDAAAAAAGVRRTGGSSATASGVLAHAAAGEESQEQLVACRGPSRGPEERREAGGGRGRVAVVVGAAAGGRRHLTAVEVDR